MRILVAYSVITVSFLMSGCNINFSSFSSAKFKKSVTQTVAHETESALRVVAHNGSVNVVQTDRTDVSISAEVRAQTQERLDQTEVIAERIDGVLTIKAVWPEQRKGNEGCRFDIEIPDAYNIDVTSSNGRISVKGFEGTAVLKTSNGSIGVNGFQGSVDAKTSNGSVTCTDVAGPITVKTSNASVKLENVTQHASVGTSNGSISMIHAAGATSDFELTSSNASIKVEVGAEFSGILDAKTSNASIKNSTSAKVLKSGKRSISLQFGNQADSKSRIHTSNGSITIRQSS